MYEIYSKLRDSNGLKDADVVRGTGITKSTFSDWKNGRSTPKNDKLQKIADYFNVSLDYLMTGEEKEGDRYYLNDETVKIAQEIFESKELRMLFNASKNASPEHLKAYHDMIVRMERLEHGDD